MAISEAYEESSHASDSSSLDSRSLSLKEYSRAHSEELQHSYWIHQLVCSDAISTGRIKPGYLVRVHYQDTKSASNTTREDFGTGADALEDLKTCFRFKYVKAVALCHRDSSHIDPEILELLWATLHVDVPFLRHHLDYKSFRCEPGCPDSIQKRLTEEEKLSEDAWTLGGRWDPISFPSETQDCVLRLSIDSGCLPLCHSDGIGRLDLSHGLRASEE